MFQKWLWCTFEVLYQLLVTLSLTFQKIVCFTFMNWKINVRPFPNHHNHLSTKDKIYFCFKKMEDQKHVVVSHPSEISSIYSTQCSRKKTSKWDKYLEYENPSSIFVFHFVLHNFSPKECWQGKKFIKKLSMNLLILKIGVCKMQNVNGLILLCIEKFISIFNF